MLLTTAPPSLARSARPILSRALRARLLPDITPWPRRQGLRTSHGPTPLFSQITLSRPTLESHKRAASVVSTTSPAGRRTIFIQTEPTPNNDALKYRPNHRVLPENFPSPYIEYLNPRSTLAPPHPSPLAAQLLAIDGVSSVFFGTDYITLTKENSIPWAHVNPEAFSLITEAITAGTPMVNTVASTSTSSEDEGQSSHNDQMQDSLAYDPQDSEVVSMIKELLETRIRPQIQEDGGDIEFRGFEKGQVMLKLRGACRTCDSSTVTLKNGIESMLRHYIEEVEGVQQILDPEEEVALREFAKFEEKLKQQKGPDAVAGTVGKGSLDTVE